MEELKGEKGRRNAGNEMQNKNMVHFRVISFILSLPGFHHAVVRPGRRKYYH